MSRKRINSYRRPRQSPGSERSYYEYLVSSPAPAITRAELVRLVRGGEDTYLELKVRFSNIEKLTAEIIALANTAGGAMVFGVNDQLRIEGVDDPEDIEAQLRDICANQIQPPVLPFINKVAFDNGRRIVVLEVESHDPPHRTLDDRFYLRDGSSKREATREELSRLYHEAFLTRFEQVPIFTSWIENDIDESLFWSYVRGINPGYWGEPTKGFPTDFVLRDMGLAIKLGDETIPTIGGLLLFGRSDRTAEVFPRANLLLTRYSGTDSRAPVVERIHARGNLLSLFDAAVAFLNRYADLWDVRPSRRMVAEQASVAERPEETFIRGRANYHRASVLEALINSLVHRDWGPRDQQARLNIFDDSIEIVNPSPAMELPIISLRYGVASPPNPRLKAIATNQHYGVPVVNGGVPMLFAESTAFARRAPEGPTIANGEFRLKLFGLC
jgi:ATP-dependent DNA helicase RecG